MPNNRKKISIKDVARVSGVSVATVSRIINNSGRFSKETQKKVQDVIKQLGYEQNKLAVSLRSNRSHTVGILVPDITNEFYASIVKKCEQWLFENELSTIICNTDRSAEREQAYLQMLMEHRVDGLIVISSQVSGNPLNDDSSLPTIYIDRKPKLKNELIISSAHYQGGRLATEFLINKHLNPFLVMTKTRSSSTLERLRAFKDVLSENGMSDIESRVLSLNLTSDKFLIENQELNDLIKNVIDQPDVPGIFGINDNVAYMVIRSAQKMGISIPKQLSVIGFDGTSSSEISSPTITTIAQNTTEIAEQACLKLTQLMNNELPASKRFGIVQIPVELEVKESTI